MVEHARGEVLHLVRVNKPGSVEPRVTAEKTVEGPARGEHTCTVCLDIVEAHGYVQDYRWAHATAFERVT